MFGVHDGSGGDECVKTKLEQMETDECDKAELA